MLTKYQFLRKLCFPSSIVNAKSLFSKNNPLQILSIYKISKSYSFSTFHSQGDIHLLSNFSPEHKVHMSKALGTYATHKEDLNQMTSNEVKWLLSALRHLSLAHIQAGKCDKAYECLSGTDHIFRKLGIKDTIDVALNYYDMSSILIYQNKFVEAEKYLNEVDRICKLLSNDQHTKILAVQSWHLLAKVESNFSQDKALEFYNVLLENVDDVNESELPSILTSVHREMGRIYRSRDDIGEMIKSWENGFQAAVKYFGENSTITFDFLCDIVDKIASRGQNARAESYAEKRVQMGLKVFPNPHENVAFSYSRLGDIYLANKKEIQARNAYNEAFKIIEKLPEDYSCDLV